MTELAPSRVNEKEMDLADELVFFKLQWPFLNVVVCKFRSLRFWKIDFDDIFVLLLELDVFLDFSIVFLELLSFENLFMVVLSKSVFFVIFVATFPVVLSLFAVVSDSVVEEVFLFSISAEMGSI